MANSKVVFNGETLMDISNDTVTPETLAEGVTAHDSRGEPIVGTMTYEDIREQVSINTKRITNLEKGLPDDRFHTDSSVAYSKTVPENALPYAEVGIVGGMTRKCSNLWKPFATQTLNGVTLTVDEDGVCTLNGTCTNSVNISGNGGTLPAGTYWLSDNAQGTFPNDTYARIQFYSDDASLSLQIDNNNASDVKKSLTLNAKTSYVQRIRIEKGHTYSNCKLYPMLNEGTTALPFEPYFEGLRSAPVTEIKSSNSETVLSALIIPEEVKTLDGYGWGINESAHNYIDWENGRFVKMVEKIILDENSNFEFRSINSHGVANFFLAISNNATNGIICDKLPTQTTVAADTTYEGIYIASVGIYVRLLSTTASNLEEFKTWLSQNPLEVMYRLKTPIVTDISHLLPEDNLIPVEGGGTVTMLNEYGYAVPSEITYQLREV